MSPAQDDIAVPTDEDVAAEWHHRSRRQGLARVMRASQPPSLNVGVTDRTRRILVDFLRTVTQEDQRPISAALELGCGVGRLTTTIAEVAGHVTAVDMTPDMLDAARARCAHLSHVDFVRGRLQDLPWRGRRFDVSVSVWVLMHLLDDAALATVCRSLAESSRYLVLVEYEQAEIPVSRWSRLRAVQDYLRLMPGGEIVRRETLDYGGDQSVAALIRFGA